jgi:hypothetical protein
MESASDYLRRRAREEHDAADRALSPKARDLHLELAARYLNAAKVGPAVPEPSAPVGKQRPGLPMDFRILE